MDLLGQGESFSGEMAVRFRYFHVKIIPGKIKGLDIFFKILRRMGTKDILVNGQDKRVVDLSEQFSFIF